MNLIMSDTPLDIDVSGRSNIAYVDLSQRSISNCVGCFGCWVKTPGKCVIRDDATKIYPLIAQSENVLYVSRVKYGSFDTPMKTILERAIPIQKAFIRLHHGETHHVQRDVKEKNATIIAYGEIAREERELFERLVARNAHNMQFRTWRVLFVSDSERDAAAKREVSLWEAC